MLGISGLGDCDYLEGVGMQCTGGGGVGTSTSSTNIWDVISSGLKASTSILSTRYGVPQLNPGQYMQTGPGGQSIQYQLAPGQQSGFPGLSTFAAGGLSTTTMLLLGGGLVLVLAMSGKGK